MNLFTQTHVFIAHSFKAPNVDQVSYPDYWRVCTSNAPIFRQDRQKATFKSQVYRHHIFRHDLVAWSCAFSRKRHLHQSFGVKHQNHQPPV